jgi:rSAM/selenodomain-associated transferase 2
VASPGFTVSLDQLGQGNDGRPTLSVIIPTLNEAKTLTQTLDSLVPQHPVEVIVVDGGSTDGTVEIARSHQVTVITASPGRASQLNAGAQAATGQVLLFLHSDTRLPPHFDRQVQQALTQGVAGAFRLAIDGPGWPLRLVEWGVNLRSRYLGWPYGDQGLFLTAELFHELGGFALVPIMEDVDLVQRLRQRGAIVMTPEAVTTSGRRWQTHGVLYTTLVNQAMLMGYWLEIDRERLARWYRHRPGRPRED